MKKYRKRERGNGKWVSERIEAASKDRNTEGERVRDHRKISLLPKVSVLHLCLRYDGFLPWLGAEEGGERGCNHKRVRPDESTQVTARDCVFFCFKHQSVHSIKLAPWQPHGALLAQEGGPLKPQSQ